MTASSPAALGDLRRTTATHSDVAGRIALIKRLALSVDEQLDRALNDGAPGGRAMALDEASHALHRAALALGESLSAPAGGPVHERLPDVCGQVLGAAPDGWRGT